MFQRVLSYPNSKFDVILVDDASEIAELALLFALALSPTSMVLFGNRKEPADDFKLVGKHPTQLLHKYFYRTTFGSFLRFGKNRVLTLKKIQKE